MLIYIRQNWTVLPVSLYIFAAAAALLTVLTKHGCTSIVPVSNRISENVEPPLQRGTLGNAEHRHDYRKKKKWQISQYRKQIRKIPQFHSKPV